MSLKHVEGNITEPVGDGPKIIIQLVNDIGGYGAGVSGAIAEKWPEVESQYRELFYKKRKVRRGWCQFVVVGTNFIVCNIFAQNGINFFKGQKNPSGEFIDRVDYESLESCLKEVGKYAKSLNSTVHSPKIGSGFAGGSWGRIGLMLANISREFGIDIYVYNYKS